jgi:anthranilate phosphoribosyltransferase
MSQEFRALLRKVGSGPHTSKNLSRAEAEAATRMILQQVATPAQIGAFMIAHRIKRPTGEELAGMLDAYDQLGPKLQPIAASHPVTILGSPYDGRSRTAPISPLTALILATVGIPVIMHGGDRMPTKDGIPFIEIWSALGLNWKPLALPQIQTILETTQLGFVYLPHHFPLAHGIVPYRDQIGKRPPFATLELMWAPYAGDHHVFAGFVHPPTETMMREAFALRGTTPFTTVKGLEGSCDLPRDRTAILGFGNPSPDLDVAPAGVDFHHQTLAPRDYGFAGKEVPLPATPDLVTAMQSVLQGQPSELLKATLWNSGFYLWRCGISTDIQAGFAKAAGLLSQGDVAEKFKQIVMAVHDIA